MRVAIHHYENQITTYRIFPKIEFIANRGSCLTSTWQQWDNCPIMAFFLTFNHSLITLHHTIKFDGHWPQSMLTTCIHWFYHYYSPLFLQLFIFMFVIVILKCHREAMTDGMEAVAWPLPIVIATIPLPIYNHILLSLSTVIKFLDYGYLLLYLDAIVLSW